MSFVLISNSIVSCKNKFKSKRERGYNRTTFRCYRDAVFKFQKRLVDKLSEKFDFSRATWSKLWSIRVQTMEMT